MVLQWPYENRSGYLYIDSVSALDIARRFGTPVYVYSENLIRKQYQRFKEAANRHYQRIRILYAVKANSNLRVLHILREEGAEIDAVSPGEIFLALEAGYKSNQILFTGTSVSLDELQYVIEKKVRINVDSETQLDKLLELDTPELVSVRINPELGAGHHDHVVTAGPLAKFGIWDKEAIEVYRKAKQAGVERFGIHMHIGSQILDVGNYIRASSKLLEIAEHIQQSTGVSFEFVDIGGGFSVPYKPDEKEVDLDAFLAELLGFIKSGLKEHKLGYPEIWLEPGRYLVAQSGALLTRVTTLKQTPHRKFLGVDAGFNTLVRPAMYGSYHEILSASALNEEKETYDIYGPLCESGDLFARQREIPRVKEGALLSIMNAGAYGFSMASHYNSRPLPSEVMVKDCEIELVRAGEKLSDLLRGQINDNQP